MFGNKKGLQHRLQEHGGTVAWATILTAEGWQSGQGGDRGFGGPAHVTDHMKVTLRVEPGGEPPFEATFRQAFPGHTPHAGGRAKVIYDPADRSKIAIMDDEVYIPGVSVEKQQRSRAHVAEAMAASESGHFDEYIEQRKAEAMRSAGIVIGGPTAPPAAGPPPPAAGPPPPAAGPPLTGAAQPTVVDQLTKLADLRDRGALTEAEFQTQKARLLAGG